MPKIGRPRAEVVLTADERDTLVKLLKRLHENLPEVEVATDRYVARHFATRARRRAAWVAFGSNSPVYRTLATQPTVLRPRPHQSPKDRR